MKAKEQQPTVQADEAIRQVLQAERDAERAIRDCEHEAQKSLREAQARAQKILSRADERITNMEMRHSHKLDREIKNIERQGDAALRLDASQQYNDAALQAVIDDMARDLCQAGKPAGEGSDTT